MSAEIARNLDLSGEASSLDNSIKRKRNNKKLGAAGPRDFSKPQMEIVKKDPETEQGDAMQHYIDQQELTSEPKKDIDPETEQAEAMQHYIDQQLKGQTQEAAPKQTQSKVEDLPTDQRRKLEPGSNAQMLSKKEARAFRQEVMKERAEKKSQQLPDVSPAPNNKAETATRGTKTKEAPKDQPLNSKTETLDEPAVVEGLEELKFMPEEEDLKEAQLRSKVYQSLEKLKTAQSEHLKTRRDYSLFDRLVNNFGAKIGINRESSQAFKEAELKANIYDVQKGLYYTDLSNYLQGFKEQAFQEWQAQGFKAGEEEQQAFLNNFAATRPVVPLEKVVDGKKELVMVTLVEFVCSQQHQLNEERVNSLKSPDKSLWEKIKSKAKGSFSRGKVISLENKIGQSIAKGEMEKLGQSLENYSSRLEKESAIQEITSVNLKNKDTLWEVLSQSMKKIGQNEKVVFSLLKDFKETMQTDLRKKYQLTPEAANHYYQWRMEHLDARETVRIVKFKGKYQLQLTGFDKYYQSDKYNHPPQKIDFKKEI